MATRSVVLSISHAEVYPRIEAPCSPAEAGSPLRSNKLRGMRSLVQFNDVLLPNALVRPRDGQERWDEVLISACHHVALVMVYSGLNVHD